MQTTVFFALERDAYLMGRHQHEPKMVLLTIIAVDARLGYCILFGSSGQVSSSGL